MITDLFAFRDCFFMLAAAAVTHQCSCLLQSLFLEYRTFKSPCVGQSHLILELF